jgi:hypothetical protein
MFKVDGQCQEVVFSQKHGRIAFPIQPTSSHLAIIRHLRNCGAYDRDPSMMKKPDYCGSGKESDKQLNDQQPTQLGAGECSHSAGSQRLPRERWFLVFHEPDQILTMMRWNNARAARMCAGYTD